MNTISVETGDLMKAIGIMVTLAVPIYWAALKIFSKNNAFMKSYITEEKAMRIKHDDALRVMDKKLDDINGKLEKKADRDELSGSREELHNAINNVRKEYSAEADKIREEMRRGIVRVHEEREKIQAMVQDHEKRISDLEKPTLFGLLSTFCKSIKNSLLGAKKII